MRPGTLVAWVAAYAIAAWVCGCGKDGEEKETPSQGSATSQIAAGQTAPAQAQPPAAAGATREGVPTAADLSKVAEQNRQMLTQANQGKEITSVGGDSLKALLPETLAGMKRVSASAEKNQMMGVDISHAEGEYEGQEGASVRLTITDVGNLSGPMKLGMTGWTMTQYSRETDRGYEKTGTYNGFKGMEEYDKEDKSSTIRVFVSERFVVELDGNSVTMDTLKQGLNQVDLKKVAAAASGS
ncbi:MAG TPA: hypothetical protein VLI39_13335 [Sedimentisphaerales bacterium]|nr:hypothetical protein [Sedimentisphaerales bacterium]